MIQLVFRVQTFAKGNCAMLCGCADEILSKNKVKVVMAGRVEFARETSGAIAIASSAQSDTRGSQQPQPTVRPDRHSLDPEVSVSAIGRFHHWRRRRDDNQICAFSNPVRVSVTVHYNHAVRKALQLSNEPVSID